MTGYASKGFASVTVLQTFIAKQKSLLTLVCFLLSIYPPPAIQYIIDYVFHRINTLLKLIAIQRIFSLIFISIFSLLYKKDSRLLFTSIILTYLMIGKDI